MERLITKDGIIYYYEGKAVYKYDFRCTDDMASNDGYGDLPGSFVGTEEHFKDFVEEQQNGFGFSCWDIKRRYATKEEYEEMVYAIS